MLFAFRISRYDAGRKSFVVLTEESHRWLLRFVGVLLTSTELIVVLDCHTAFGSAAIETRTILVTSRTPT